MPKSSIRELTDAEIDYIDNGGITKELIEHQKALKLSKKMTSDKAPKSPKK